MSPSEQAAANRAAFPQLAAMVDEFRAVFGPGVRLLHGVEGGRELRPDTVPNGPAPRGG